MTPIDGLTYNCMTELDWDEIEHFDQEEFEHPNWLDHSLIFTLDELRDYVGKPFHIHCDFEFREKFSWHSEGFAIDGHFENMHPFDQYQAVSRFDAFNGIGFYLDWENPGIHLDTRLKEKTEYDARWFSPKKGVYLPVTAENLRRYL